MNETPTPVTFLPLALHAVETWIIPGPVPEYHEARKREIQREWPDLFHALEAMARFDGATVYARPVPATPPVDPATANTAAAGLYALTRLGKALPEGPARTMVREVIRRPYAAAYAAVQIAASLGCKLEWDGVDETTYAAAVLERTGMPSPGGQTRDALALYRALADQLGMAYDEDEDADA